MKTFIRTLRKKEVSLFFELFTEASPIKHCIVYALFDKLEMIGGVVLNKKPAELPQCKSIAISYFYILEQYRGKGLGKKLIERVIKKHKSIILTTGPKTNVAAHHIYKASGFQVTGTCKGIKYWSYIEKPIENITDYDFYCIPHKCKMLKSACVKRQKMARVPSSFQNSPVYTQGGCATCKDAYKDIVSLKSNYSKIEALAN